MRSFLQVGKRSIQHVENGNCDTASGAARHLMERWPVTAQARPSSSGILRDRRHIYNGIVLSVIEGDFV